MSVVMRIFCGGRCNIVTGSRVLTRRSLEMIDIEKVAADKIHPVVLEVSERSGKATRIEMAESDAFELAMAILEKGLSEGYLSQEVVTGRLQEMAIDALRVSRNNRKRP